MIRFFRKPPFGLDISDYSVEIIKLGGSPKFPRLLAMARTILDPGVVENSQILNKEKLKTALQDLIKKPKFGKIETKEIIFAFPESRVFIHFFELPQNLSQKEQLQYIKSEAERTFPYSLKELYFDFRKNSLQKVLLVAAPKKMVDAYLEVFEASDLKPVALETESLSLARALIRNPQPTLVADIGARTTNLSLFCKGQLRLSFSSKIAGNVFTKSMAQKLKISPEKAEKLKRKIGLNPSQSKGEIFMILQKEIQELIWEIKKIENYFWKKESKAVKKIILAGGCAVLPFLPEYLAQNLNKKVEIGDPWVKINIDILKKKEYFQKALEVNPVLYSTVIGCALRGLSKNPKRAGINLIKL